MLIKDKFANRLEDVIYEVLFPKEKREKYKYTEQFFVALIKHEADIQTEKIKTAVLKLIPKEILEELDKEVE